MANLIYQVETNRNHRQVWLPTEPEAKVPDTPSARAYVELADEYNARLRKAQQDADDMRRRNG